MSEQGVVVMRTEKLSSEIDKSWTGNHSNLLLFSMTLSNQNANLEEAMFCVRRIFILLQIVQLLICERETI